MEESSKPYMFFAVTKGERPGAYTSWEEANEIISNTTFPEYLCFNSFELAELAFKRRMSCILSERAAHAELVGEHIEGGQCDSGSSSCGDIRRMLVVSCKFAPIFFGDPEFHPPASSSKYVFFRGSGPYFGFNVVVPGHPFEVEMYANGRFSTDERAAREDAAHEMLGIILEMTRKEIKDYNYMRVKLLSDSNRTLRGKVEQLEEANEKLKASYEAAFNASMGGVYPRSN
ncbi:hypothetical protein PIB30_067870 [Stylosanthes scabra]|uniref:Ribonuclease H1 N-terminal domain-containing protein n=1 Tax=Stylosanthes scabra TaxID=79078 RepID=A0ABU6YLL5_9FABA|nr:hypothetical protein [Stylosanthes scabra]